MEVVLEMDWAAMEVEMALGEVMVMVMVYCEGGHIENPYT